MYEYTARLIDNYDGDTLSVEITLIDETADLGFGEVRTFRETKAAKLRLYGVNAPEIRAAGPDGEAARDWVAGWFSLHCPNGWFVLNTFKTSSLNPFDKEDKYGRYLAIVTSPDGRRLNDDLILSGHGVPYMVT